MNTVCPRCHHSITLADAEATQAIHCAACGSSFDSSIATTGVWDSNGQAQEASPAATFPLGADVTAIWGLEQGATKIDRFELIGELGKGAFGTVYKARDPKLDRIVAIKVPRQGANIDETRFFREARSVARLRHPAIVPLHEAGQWQRVPFIVSEFIEGTTLYDRLTAHRPSPREAAELIAAIAEALDYAHSQGVIHRDIKPANVMVSPDGKPHVMDFGMAKRESGEATMTMEGQLLGTPAYMSPEQARGDSHKVDGRSDIYSVGVMLYELLAGTLPFQGSVRMLLHQVVHEEPRSLRSVNHRLPRDLETICQRAMAKEPENRYRTGALMATDLRLFLAGQPIQARPIGRPERLYRWCKRHPVEASLTCLAAVLLVAGTAVSTLFAIEAGRRAEEADFSARVAMVEKERADAKTAEVEASEKAIRAEKLISDRRLYDLDLRQVDSAWEKGQIDLVRDLLASQLPRRSGDADFRGFEWFYWNRLCQADLHTLAGHAKSVLCVAYSPDGRKLASGGKDGVLKIWDSTSNRAVLSLSGHSLAVRSVAFSPDGKQLLSGSDDRSAKLWDLETGKEILALKGHGAAVLGVGFSPDGKVVATACKDGALRLWDLAKGPDPLVLKKGSSLVCLAFSADSKRLATGAAGGEITIWDLANHKVVRSLEGHAGGVTAVEFSPDSSQLASSGADRIIRIWDAAAGKEKFSLKGHTDAVTGLAFLGDGAQLVSTGADGCVITWDATTGKALLTLKGHVGAINGIGAHRGGKSVATAGEDRTLRIWDVDLPVYRGHTSGITSVAFSPDGKTVATASWDRTVRLWNTADARLLFTLKGHTSGVTCVAFDPDGKHLASGSWDKSVILWDVTTGKENKVFQGHTKFVRSLAFSPDGRHLATGSDDQTVRVWELASGRDRLILNGHQDAVQSVCFSPDGQRLASCGDDKTIKLWDLATGREQRSLEGHSSTVYSVSFSPDGKRLVSASDDQTVRTWNVLTGLEERTLKGHAGPVFAAIFTPDGKRLASASFDGAVKLWDAATGQEALTLEQDNSPAHGLAFSPDGRRLALASDNLNLQIWNATPEDRR